MEEKKVYDQMDWAAIEAVVYSEADAPQEVLGPRVTEDGVLVGAFVPEAQGMTLVTDKGAEYPMLNEDEAGYFAALLPGKKIPGYTLRVQHRDGRMEEFADPYAFEPYITQEDCRKFGEGIHYTIYEKLGAHILTRKAAGGGSVTGTLFAVWAPNAMRVSVVGNFNNWDGRRHQMVRLGDSGIFELFVPGVSRNEIYKYEIKARGGLTYLKADPYANAAELRPANASVVTELSEFTWTDEKWMTARAKKKLSEEPVSIYEVHLGSFRKPEEKNGSFYNYRELAVMLADYVKKMGYTHIELMPVMEHPFDGSWGYQVTGYYAATSRYGTPQDFMYFMNYMHEKGIGVILDWVPAHFPRDTFGLSNFDGTCLYEHEDPRKGSHPHWGTLIYNYARPQVSNFLIANALFWVEKYHADGIRMDAVASMLYLDYGKRDGEWVANERGGNENLDAIELLRHLNSVFHKRRDGAVLIAEESTAWPEVTADVEKGGLGFDFKWNMGWMNDFTNYMKQDPLFRKGCHGALTFSMVYAYSEKFVLVLSHDEVVHGKASMLYKMPGTMEQKFANLRLAYGFMMTHPGKKLLFMGQEFGQTREWNEERSLDWNLLEYDAHRDMQDYSAKLNELYRKHPALYEADYDPEGFSWISSLDADHSRLSFVRRSKKSAEQLFIICNFTPVEYTSYNAAVPFEGKYKEIFNSDALEFGGSGMVNPRAKQTKKGEVDGQQQYIEMTLPPLGIVIFSAEEAPKKAPAKNTKKEDVKAGKKTENVTAKKAGTKTAAEEEAPAQKAPAKAETAEVKKAPAETEAVAEEEAATAQKKDVKAGKKAENVTAKKVETEAAAAEAPAQKAAAKTETAEVKKAPAETEAAIEEEAPAKAEAATAQKKDVKAGKKAENVTAKKAETETAAAERPAQKTETAAAEKEPAETEAAIEEEAPAKAEAAPAQKKPAETETTETKAAPAAKKAKAGKPAAKTKKNAKMRKGENK